MTCIKRENIEKYEKKLERDLLFRESALRRIWRDVGVNNIINEKPCHHLPLI